MMNPLPAPGKKVAILGMGVSGYAAAVFLHQKGFRVFVSEQGNSEAILKKAGELSRLGIETETGSHTFSRLLDSDWAVISPGIPPSAPVVQALREAEIPIYSEIEVASWFCLSKNVIAVTGSSGKTTVTTLLGRLLAKSKGKTIVCGNIGNPWIREIEQIEPDDYVVVEISSFQLVYCEHFRPKVGLLLNLSQNHQDWHPDMKDYATAKLRMFQRQQTEDFAIIRREDQKSHFPDFEFHSKVIGLEESRKPGTNPNETAVRIVAEIFACDPGITEEVLRSFEGIEHRLEKVGTSAGVTFVNDSKSTTTASLAWALEKFSDGSVVLIAGGHPKSNDFEAIRGLIKRKVRMAILIGEARPLLREAWGKDCFFWETDDFRAAVLKARAAAKPGDTVLLSPACASFDMFQNYMERGNLFKTIAGEMMAASQSSAALIR